VPKRALICLWGWTREITEFIFLPFYGCGLFGRPACVSDMGWVVNVWDLLLFPSEKIRRKRSKRNGKKQFNME